MEFLLDRDMRARDKRRAAQRAGRAVAHFTLDGRPLCTHSCVAYRDRIAGTPCEDTAAQQSRRFAKFAAQFPGRVALVGAACPHSPKEATP